MNFCDYIKEGERLSGSSAALATRLDQRPTAISDAKAGKRGLPDRACVQLGQIVGLENPMDMIAIRNEWLAKSDEEAIFWAGFAKHAVSHAGRAASMLIAVTAAILTGYSNPSSASTMTPHERGLSNSTIAKAVFYYRRLKNWLAARLSNRLPLEPIGFRA